MPIVEKELIQPAFGIVHKLHMSIIVHKCKYKWLG